jgi:hypothetical protein
LEILVDSNVILDVVTENEKWFQWSSDALANCADDNILVINPIIYAEISIRFKNIEDLEEALLPEHYRRDQLPWEAAFLAGKCFVEYRRKGGEKHAPLPDFYIGAHAAVTGMPLLTRDDTRYRTYFPKLKIIAPGV